MTSNIFDATSALEDVEASGDPYDAGMLVHFKQSGLRLTTLQALGKGAFGVVFAAKDANGSMYALKVNAKDMNEREWARVTEEVALTRHFTRHPNTVKLFTAGRDASHIFIVMERCHHMNLHDLLSRRELYTHEVLWVGFQLVKTVQYLNDHQCVHRDLKPANLLFDFRGNIKITDFGLASRVSDVQPRKTVAGTLVYMAPELAEHARSREGSTAATIAEFQYGCEVDVWSVGIILFVIATKANPYVRSDGGLPSNAKDFLAVVSRREWQWPASWDGDQELRDFVNRILKDRAHRPTIRELADDPIWRRAPHSCPSSMLELLGLVPSAKSNNQTNTDNGPDRGRSMSSSSSMSAGVRKLMPPGEYLRYALDSIASDELRARQRLTLEASAYVTCLSERCNVAMSQSSERSDIADLEVVQRARIFETYRNQSMVKFGIVARHQHHHSQQRYPPPYTGGGVGGAGSAMTSRAASVMMIEEDIGGRLPFQQQHHHQDLPNRYGRVSVSMPRAVFEATSSSQPHQQQLNNNNITPARGASLPFGVVANATAAAAGGGSSPPSPGRVFVTVSYTCKDCGKKFTSPALLQRHSPTCRGPSVEQPQHQRGTSHIEPLTSVEWKHSDERKSSLTARRRGEFDNNSMPAPPLSSTMEGSSLYDEGGATLVGRMSHGPPSTARMLRMSAANAYNNNHQGGSNNKGQLLAPFYENTSIIAGDSMWMTSATTRASSGPSVHQRQQQQQRPSAVTNNSTTSSDFDDFDQMIPDTWRLSKRLREEEAKGATATAMLRQSIDLTMSPLKQHRRSGSHRRDDALGMPFALTEEVLNEPVGIAAQRAFSRARSVESSSGGGEGLSPTGPPPSSSGVGGAGTFEIRAVQADKPLETGRQPQVARKAFSKGSTETTSTTKDTAAITSSSSMKKAPTPKPTHGPAAKQLQASMSSTTTTMPQPQPQPQNRPMPISNADGDVIMITPSKSNNNHPYSVPPQFVVGPFSSSAHAPPPTTMRSGSVSERGSVGAMPSPVQVQLNAARPILQNSPLPRVAAGGAYLALPQQANDRHNFVEQFLSGPWVRCYSFGFDSMSLVHYSLQPGRYGSTFANDQGGIGTAVVDIHSGLVLYVQSTNLDASNRTQPHPHVQTFYDEPIKLMPITEATRLLPDVMNSISNYVNELTRLHREGLTSMAVSATFVHNHAMSSVPRDTKFAYIRKVFPDLRHSAVLFRLSNLRSQIVAPSMGIDIRWQSDRNNNVGTKYYVFQDGRAEPFVEDRTGILRHMQTTLENSYRRAQ